MMVLLNDCRISASTSSFSTIRHKMSLCHLYMLDLTYLLSVEFGMVYCGILAKNLVSSLSIEIRISCGGPIGCWPAFVGAKGLCSNVTCLVNVIGGLIIKVGGCVVMMTCGSSAEVVGIVSLS